MLIIFSCDILAFSLKDIDMGRLFIFSNSSRVDNFIRDIFMPDDSFMLFESHVTTDYVPFEQINGGPSKSYVFTAFEKDTALIYNFNDINSAIEPLKLNYNEKTEFLKYLSTYTEICIVSAWDDFGDYFGNVYNYLFSLSDTRNDCLPISVCGPETNRFENRQSLHDYMRYAPKVKAYYNKEYMNIAVINYFKSIYNLSMTFDECVMLHVVDRSTEKLTHCPAYLIYNNLNNNLITSTNGFKLFENLYTLKYITNYDHNGTICVTTLDAYKDYKNDLLNQGINYEAIVDTFENASRYEHDKFKQHIDKYFEKLANLNKKEATCN